MKPDFLKYLPAEITTNIFSRLSVRSIAASKCVCKPWLQLLETDDFVSSHFAISAPALAFTTPTEDSNWLKLFELKEDLNLDLDLDPLTKFVFPYKASIEGSANGLLFLFGVDRGYHLYICNPITREFIELFRREKSAFGFGVSRTSGEHKVVCISPRYFGGDHGFECHVYTLGTRTWRPVASTDPLIWCPAWIGTFAHGNLHWIAPSNLVNIDRITCFDLEMESFSSFTVPPLPGSNPLDRELYSLRDSLAFFGGLLDGGCEVVIWMMKEYGVEESWTKEYVIDLGIGDPECQWFHPIQVFENGDVLLGFDDNKFFYYSKRSRTSREVGALFGAGQDEKSVTSMLHTPSMDSLKWLAPIEKVISF